jgi:hypothetical protein
MKDHCHSEPFAVILSAAKDLALGAQGKLREESRSAAGEATNKKQGEILRFAQNDSVGFAITMTAMGGAYVPTFSSGMYAPSRRWAHTSRQTRRNVCATRDSLLLPARRGTACRPLAGWISHHPG